MNQEIKAVVERLRDSTEEAQGHDFKFVADARVEDMQVLLAYIEELKDDKERLDWLDKITSYADLTDRSMEWRLPPEDGYSTLRGAIDAEMGARPTLFRPRRGIRGH